MAKKKKKNVDWVTVLLVLILLLGVGIIAYPTVADKWNSYHSSQAMASYEDYIDQMSPEEYQKLMEEAVSYNKELASEYTNIPGLNKEEMAKYETVLNTTGNGMMGIVEIPKIRVKLPIYHGVEEGTLQTSAGHLPGSSLPIGGETVHSVVTGHRGLTSAVLFTHLDKLEVGDVFMYKVLKETYTYEVDDIRVIEPEDVSSLVFEDGKDLSTLVTCTPYGINSHRLLITGHRIENLPEGAIDAISDAVLITPVQIGMYATGAFLVLLFGWSFWSSYKKKNKKSKVDSLKKKDAERSETNDA